MEHAHHRSSFNTDEHHYCSTDNEMLKEEPALIILIIMLTAATSICMPLWSIVVFDSAFFLSLLPLVSLHLIPSADPHPGGLECGAL